MKRIEVTPDQARQKLRELREFRRQLADCLQRQQWDPTFESRARTEAEDFADPSVVPDFVSQGNFLVESAADHAMAVERVLEEPVQSIAPFTCVRCALEAASTCAWLLDETIPPRERLSRSLTLRHSGVVEQEKLARQNPQSETIEECERTRQRLMVAADRFGIEIKRDKKGRANGFGQTMPSVTDLAKRAFGRDQDFRICSAVAHGHLWALQQVGFVRADEKTPPGIVAMKKALPPEMAIYLVCLSAEAVAMATWCWTQYCGYDLVRIRRVLQFAVRDFGMKTTRARWRPPANES